MNTLQTARATALGMALFAGVATAANAAQPAVEPITVQTHHGHAGAITVVKVNYADLDIRTQDGAAALAGRILAASDEVCGGRPGKGADDAQKADFAECRTNTMYDAVQSVDSPLLRRVTNGGRAPVLRSE